MIQLASIHNLQPCSLLNSYSLLNIFNAEEPLSEPGDMNINVIYRNFSLRLQINSPLIQSNNSKQDFYAKKNFKKKLGGSLCAMMSSSSFSNIFIFHCCKLHKHKIYYVSNRVPEQTQTQTPAIRSQP